MAALVLSGSCSRDSTGPAPVRIASLSVAPQFASLSSGLVTFTKVRITLTRPGGTGLAADTVIDFPPGADSIVVEIHVALGSGLASEPFDLSLAMVNAQGDTVFRGGPTRVSATLAPPAEAAVVTVVYSGTGANAARVVAQADTSLFFGDSLVLSAVAQDTAGAAIPGTPVAWISLDTLRAVVSNPGAGRVRAKSVRGTVRMVAQLLTGPADTLSLTVQPLAAALGLVSGGGQTALPNAQLPLPLVAKVLAADSLPVRGVPVRFQILAGGGVLSDTLPVTDSLGLVSVRWTLGGAPGAASLRISSGSLVNSPVTVGATVGAFLAKVLAFTTPPAAAIVGAAITPPIVVAARDSLGGAATGFVGQVTLTLGTNPAGAVLGGTTAVPAVAGVATFNNVTLDKLGAGYTMVASSGTLTPATSAPFGVSAGAASLLAAISGGGQVAFVGGNPTDSLLVRVTDAGGNGISGRAITWSVAGGGGSLSTTSTTTSATGHTFVRYTMGPAPGANLVTATDAGLGQSVTFTLTAVPVGVTRTWLGTTADWFTAGNWSPAVVPVSTDNVYIAQVGSAPALTGAIAVNDLTMEAGSRTLTDNGFAVTVNGSYDVPVLNGGGNLTLGGAPAGFARGQLNNNASLIIGGKITLSGALATGGTITVTGATARVDLAGHTLQGASLTTLNGARLRMGSAADSLVLAGPATFNGASMGDSLLTAGVMRVAGNLSNNSFDNFAAAGTHLVVFEGAATQTVTMNGTGLTQGTSHFRNLRITTSPAALAGNIAVTGDLQVQGSGSITGNVTATIGGNLTSGVIPASGLLAWGVLNTTFAGTNPTIPDSLPSNVTFAGPIALAKNFNTVGGNSVTVNGVSARLQLSGHTLATGSFSVVAGGKLVMQNALDSLRTLGAVSFTGAGMGDSLLTAGVIETRGGSWSNSSFDNFNAAGTHKVVFDGTAFQTISLNGAGTAGVNAHFRQIEFNNAAGVAFASNGAALGTATILNGNVTGSVNVILGANLVDAAGTRWQVGNTQFTGVNPVIPDSMPQNVMFFGNNSLAKNFKVTGGGSLTVSGSTLDLNGHTASVTGTFTTQSSGRLKMAASLDSLIVAGPMSFTGSGMGDSLLTPGVLVARGDISNNSFDNFNAAGTHRTVLAGAALQTISLNGAGPAAVNSHFRDVEVNNPAGVAFAANGHVSGNLTVTSGNVTGNVTVTLGGNLTDALNTRWQINNTVFSGTNPVIPDSVPSNVVFSGAATLAKNLKVTGPGTLTVNGASAKLTINGHTVRSVGAFTVTGGGRLKMINATDTLDMGGDASFAGGGMGDTLLTAGVVIARGAAWSNNSFDNFNASGTHKVVFAGTAAQTITMNGPGAAAVNSHFRDVEVNNPAGVAFAANGHVTGNLTVTSGTVTGAVAVTLGGNLVDALNTRWQVLSTTFTGTNPALPDSISSNVVIGSPITLAKNLKIRGGGNLTVLGATAKLTLNGHTARVTNGFTVLSSAQFKMANVLDSLIVAQGISLTGAGMGDTLLTAGVMILTGGNFDNSSFDNFSASGTHKVVFGGTAAQTISMSAPGPASVNSHFRDLEISNAAGVSFSSGGQVNGNVLITAGNVSGSTVTIAGNLVDPLNTRWQLNNTVLSGTNPSFPDSLASNVTFTAPVTLTKNFKVVGGKSLTISGASAKLTLNGHTARSTGAFTVSGSAQLKMTGATDTLDVGGDAAFQGAGMGDSLLTAGVVIARGNWSNSSFDNFNAGGTQKVVLGGTVAQTISVNGPGAASVNSHFRDFEVNNPAGVTFLTAAQVNGSATVTAGNVTGAGISVTIAGGLIDAAPTRWQVAGTVFSGINPALPDSIASSVTFTNAATLTKSLKVIGSTSISGALAKVTLNGHTLRSQPFVLIQPGGAVKMTNPLDSMIATSMGFDGVGTGDSLFTAGVIVINGGNFVNNTAGAFTGSGTNKVVYASGGSGVNLTGPGPGPTQSHFQNLEFSSPSNVTIGTNGQVNGDLTVTNGNVVNAAARTWTIAGNLVDAASSRWQITNTILTGANPSLPDSVASNVTFTGASVLAKNFGTKSGFSLTISGAAARLALNNHTVRSGAAFTVSNTAKLRMANAVDSLVVAGDISFTGQGMGDTLLTAGLIVARGNWSNGNFDLFNASGTHRVLFAGTVAQTITMPASGTGPTAGHFRNIDFANLAGVTWLTDGNVTGNLTVTSGNVTGPASAVVLGGDYIDAANGRLDLALLEVTKTNPALPDSIQSNLLFSSAGNTVLTKNLILGVGRDIRIQNGALTLNGHTARTRGSFYTLAGSRLRMLNALDTLDIAFSANWTGIGMGDSLLTAGVIIIRGQNNNWVNSAADNFNASGTHKVVFTGGFTQNVNLNGPGPASAQSHFRHVDVTGGTNLALVTNTQVNGVLRLGTGATVTGGTQRLAVQDSLIGAPTSSITTRAVDLAGVLTDTGTFQPDTAVFLGAGATAQQIGATFAGFLFKSVRVTTGSSGAHFNTGGGCRVVTGNLNVTAGAAQLTTSDCLSVLGDFGTSGTGTLVMNGAAPQLIVSGNATFAGASTNGLLSGGSLAIAGNFSQTAGVSAASFAPSVPFLTILSGGAQQTVSFASPDSLTTGSHFAGLSVTNASAAGTTFGVKTFVEGDLTVGGTGAVRLAGAGATPALFARGLQLNNAVFDNLSLVLGIGSATTVTIQVATFQNMDKTAVQFAVHRPNSTLLTTFDKLTFTTVPTTGKYLEAFDTNGLFDPALTVVLTNASPISSVAQPFISQLNGASVTWTP